METVTFEVTGIPPGMMMHAPGSMVTPSGKPGAIKVKTIPSPEDEAELGCYRLPSGQVYIPGAAFIAATYAAISGLRIGKNTARSQFVVFTHEEHCPVYHPETKEPIREYVIDTRRVTVGPTKEGVMRSRPKFPEWSARVIFAYDDRFLGPDQIEAALTDAGTRIGILELRPRPKKGNPGPFGRFVVKRI